MKEYTVKEVASLLGKHEETVKRWIRAGKLSNSYRNSDKEGWRILESDLSSLNKIIVPVGTTEQNPYEQVKSDFDDTGLIKLAYEAVTLASPTDDIISILNVVGIKRTLEILLIMQQSPTKVKNPNGFIKKAIRENWSPDSILVTIPRKQGKHLYDLTQQDYNPIHNNESKTYKQQVHLYNWLED
ncbi:helix-turn-helix domain-containing protein [Bacillus cereus group sp. BfR-BA-01355]|uniref:helix-turn-helix domain-containing protein n=1 Tax=Bacillus cereus group sp. BfR-BA-01355 TaxID=2920318 RepID=UPI001F5893EC|nr:helix-turn-helix domain-containing protein [Bacillus cereus group sp. BfR-BA-01355]